MIAFAVALLLGVQDAPQRLTLDVAGYHRRAYVFPGSASTSKPRPLVFVFHGFGGSGINAMNAYRIHTAWPEAIVVYPTGLEVRNARLKQLARGWQDAPDSEGGRDLLFVDEMIRQIEARYNVDKKRVFACGMSNGGLFTFLLLHSRPSSFRAFATVAAAGGSWLARSKTPKPILMMIGKKDPLIPLAGFELTREFLVKLNRCDTQPTKWQGVYDDYKSKSGNDVISYTHKGGHRWPEGATEAVVKFFKTR